MTLEELVATVDGKRVCRHHGRCFINVRSDRERDHFVELGATTRSYSGGGLVGHEVYLREMLDPVFEEGLKGEQVDVRERVLLAFFRERDGFSMPLFERLYAKGQL